MEKKDYIILVDMDDTLEQLLATWINLLNERYDLNVDFRDVHTWEMSPTFPTLTKSQIYGVLSEEVLWQNVKPIPDAVKYTKKLIDEGFTVRVCTASTPASYALKMKYVLERYFPFFDTRLDCICAHDKYLIRANVLIDDNFKNLEGGTYKGVLFTRPYNEDYIPPENSHMVARVKTWKEFYNWVEKDFEEIKVKSF